MATYTVGASGGDYTTLAAAIAAASTGDTISILANFSHDNTTVTVNKTDLTIESATETAADAVIASSLSKTISLSNNGVALKNLTINNTYTSTGYALYANKTFSMQDCILSMSHVTAGHCIYGPKSGSTIVRTQLSGGSRGITQATSSQPFTVDSCLFKNHNFAGMYNSVGEVTIRNCTVYANTSTSGTPYGIYTGTTKENVTIYNTIVYVNGSNGLDYGIRMGAYASNTIKNCIVFGNPITADYDGEESPTVSDRLLDTDDVTADGNPVFETLGSDFHPDTSGVAYHSGLAAGAPTLDLDGNEFDRPPSRGCLEAVSTGIPRAVLEATGAGFLNNPFTITL